MEAKKMRNIDLPSLERLADVANNLLAASGVHISLLAGGGGGLAGLVNLLWGDDRLKINVARVVASGHDVRVVHELGEGLHAGAALDGLLRLVLGDGEGSLRDTGNEAVAKVALLLALVN